MLVRNSNSMHIQRSVYDISFFSSVIKNVRYKRSSNIYKYYKYIVKKIISKP